MPSPKHFSSDKYETGVSSPDEQTFSVQGSRREQDKSRWDEEKLPS